MSRSILRTAAVITSTAALAGAPAAFARPADNVVVKPAPAAPHLTLAQLKAVDGHQPPAPLVTTPRVPAAPLTAAQPGGGTTAVPWIAGGAALLLFAAFGIVRFSGVRPLRRHQPAA